MKRTMLTAFIITILVSGCASTAGNQSINDETQQSVQSKLIKGKTTEAQVLSMYSEPTSKTSMRKDGSILLLILICQQQPIFRLSGYSQMVLT
ncbi:hypothetical protein RBA63_06870 [Brenneria goodwinii]|uniref:hypothetical protein n=1 Tax=Brenneria goodwinii TaxID=1109412 RepID=UPI0036E2308C